MKDRGRSLPCALVVALVSGVAGLAGAFAGVCVADRWCSGRVGMELAVDVFSALAMAAAAWFAACSARKTADIAETTQRALVLAAAPEVVIRGPWAMDVRYVDESVECRAYSPGVAAMAQDPEDVEAWCVAFWLMNVGRYPAWQVGVCLRSDGAATGGGVEWRPARGQSPRSSLLGPQTGGACTDKHVLVARRDQSEPPDDLWATITYSDVTGGLHTTVYRLERIAKPRLDVQPGSEVWDLVPCLQRETMEPGPGPCTGESNAPC